VLIESIMALSILQGLDSFKFKAQESNVESISQLKSKLAAGGVLKGKA